ncbi:MAG: VWA domain-containing protein [Pseudomonadota bacterium]
MGTQPTQRSTFLRTLRDDTSANTIVIAAAALIPLIGMVGGAVDSSRYYMAASRLQAACDAGALAARRAMPTDSFEAQHRQIGENFFDQNYPDGTFGLANLNRAFTADSDGMVTGTATGELPTSLMGVFGYEEFDLSVSCTAEINISNTDIMFVLDTTGSMGSTLGSGTRLSALQDAVMNFYDTVELATSDSAQVRYGVVPYAQLTNVGGAIPTQFMANTHTYQSRAAEFELEEREITTLGDWEFHQANFIRVRQQSKGDFLRREVTQTISNIGNNNCRRRKPSKRLEYVDELGPYGYVNQWVNGDTRRTRYDDDNEDILIFEGFAQFNRNGGGRARRCEIGYNVYRGQGAALWDLIEKRATETEIEEVIEFDRWVYRPVDLANPPDNNKDGDTNITERPSWDQVNLATLYDDNRIDMPIGEQGAMTTVTWDGCVEEAQTVRSETYSPVPTGAFDLDINLIPTTEEQRWKPVLRDAVWRRENGSGNTTSWLYQTGNERRANSYACPQAAFRLTDISRGDLQTYVNSLTANGFTYHDVGMIWGARFISPQGIFAADNDSAPNGDAIARHIVFMTDGRLVMNTEGYGAYGIEWWDRRVTSNGDGTAAFNRHAARFQAACAAARNENITVWTVAFGTPLDQNLIDCASPGRAYSANSADALNNAFQEIAQKIAALRLTS